MGAVSIYGHSIEDAPSDVLEEMRAERRRRAKANHWCEDCRGHRGGPCDFGEDEPEDETEDEGEEA